MIVVEEPWYGRRPCRVHELVRDDLGRRRHGGGRCREMDDVVDGRRRLADGGQRARGRGTGSEDDRTRARDGASQWGEPRRQGRDRIRRTGCEFRKESLAPGRRAGRHADRRRGRARVGLHRRAQRSSGTECGRRTQGHRRTQRHRPTQCDRRTERVSRCRRLPPNSGDERVPRHPFPSNIRRTGRRSISGRTTDADRTCRQALNHRPR